MIEAIEIQNLRGIRQGKLEGFTPLTILVGPNGCGKSTILDGLLLVGCPDHLNAGNFVLARSLGSLSGQRWLIRKGERGVQAFVDLHARLTDQKERIRHAVLEYKSTTPGQVRSSVLGISFTVYKGQGRADADRVATGFFSTQDPHAHQSIALRGVENIYLGRDDSGEWIPEVRFLDLGFPMFSEHMIERVYAAAS